jgi:hypothetical protein
MTTRTIIRPLVIALAALALIASPAFARPGGPASEHAAALQAAKAKPAQNLGPVYWSYGYEAAAPKADPGRVYWSYDYQAPTPHAHPAPAVAADDNDTPWIAIGAGLAGICLVLVSAGTALRLRPDRATV